MVASVLVASLTVALAAQPAPARPGATRTRPTRPAPLRIHHAADLAVTVGLGVGWLGSEALLKRTLAPAQCRWCDRDAQGADTLNAVDRAGRALRWSPTRQHTADVLSGVLDYVTVPLGLAALDVWGVATNADVRDLADDALVITEATMAAMVLDQAVKFSVGRERPFVHARSPEERAALRDPDDNVSFYSGHTTFAFVLASAFTTVAEERGYVHSSLLWEVGIPAALGVGYLRMAADKHYVIDVLTGAAVGTAIGIALPRWAHGRSALPEGTTLRLIPMGEGAALVGAF